MNKLKKIVIIAILLTLFGCKADYLEGPYKVDRVVDGDTLIVYINNKRTRIRALCIDTPESVAPENSNKSNTSEGIIASNRAKEILEGSEVYLEYDEEKYDQYDRVLAYVYTKNKKSFEEIMISEGLAKVVVYGNNKKHAEDYYKLQEKAKQKKVGFYGTGFYK